MEAKFSDLPDSEAKRTLTMCRLLTATLNNEAQKRAHLAATFKVSFLRLELSFAGRNAGLFHS
jgi:hypothetical protein